MKRKHFFYLPILLLSSFTLTSCLNDDGDPAEIRPGFISFINAMPDTTELDFYVSTSQNVTSNDLLGNGPLDYTKRYPTSSYVQAQPYTYLLTVSYADGDTLLLQGAVRIDQDTYSSVYIYSTADSVKGILRQDDLESPAAGTAKVRFINLGQETPEVDLVAEGETTPWFSGVDFEEVSGDYEEVPAGAYMLNIQESSTSEVLTSGSVDLEDSKVYTIWVKGIYEGTGQKALGIEFIEHVPVEQETATP